MASLEFRSFKDDAWYDAHVITDPTRLTIKFIGFNDDDEVVYAKRLKKLQHVDALRARFRKVSAQFQDTDCSKVRPGLLVCARRVVSENDRKFYDGVLRQVVRKEHRIENGEQVCTCRFILDWIDSGERGSCSVENICRVLDTTDEELDPGLVSFLNKARERIESVLSTRLSVATGGVYDLRGRCKDTSPSSASLSLSSSAEEQSSNRSFKSPHKFSLEELPALWIDDYFLSTGMGTDSDIPLRISYEADHVPKKHKKTSPAKGSLALSCYVEGISDNASDMDEQDDMDVRGNPYMVIVENLEKEISPSVIMEFINQQVSITCQASVSASKLSEMYTRAIILLDSKKNLEKLSDFLESPDHIIISSSGRPWLMTEKRRLPAQRALETGSNELSVVPFGSEEYKKAKELQKLFQEFDNNQGALQRRLKQEEGMVSEMYR